MSSDNAHPVGKLEFPLPECQAEFLEAVNGGRYLAVIHAVDQRLRSTEKHGTNNVTASEVRSMIRDELSSYSLSLD